jgi:hypothetical protein
VQTYRDNDEWRFTPLRTNYLSFEQAKQAALDQINGTDCRATRVVFYNDIIRGYVNQIGFWRHAKTLHIVTYHLSRI